MLKKLLASIFVVLVFTSCKKEHESNLLANAIALNGTEETVLLTLKDIPVTQPDLIFIIADLEGNILSQQPYHKGEGTIALKTAKDFEDSKINLFQVHLDSVFTTVIVSTGLQVNSELVYYNASKFSFGEPMSLRLKNVTDFKSLYTSTDQYSQTITSIADTTSLYNQQIYHSSNSKLFVKVEKENDTYYRLFDINPDKNQQLTVDFLKINIKATKQKVQLPEWSKNVYANVYGKIELNSRPYSLESTHSTNENLDITYPNNCFKSYECDITINRPYDPGTIGQWRYTNIFQSIPTRFEPLNIDVKAISNSRESFNLKFNGEADYLQAFFYNLKDWSSAYFVQSETSTGLEEIRWPNLASALKTPALDVNNFTLIDVNFVKFDSNFSFPEFLAGKPHTPDSYKIATFEPKALESGKVSVDNNWRQKIVTATTFRNKSLELINKRTFDPSNISLK